jgi:aspartyl-tRNA(Asn)/glutamyl-tRNA(Gln) amidotransferase subunit A
MLDLHPPEHATIYAVGQQIRSGKRKCREVLETCLRQIDANESTIHAWVTVDRHGAGKQAELLDAERDRGRYRGPLHGIPIAIKDIVDVQGFGTAAGSELLGKVSAKEDATIVARLRAAGAIILGKTVTTQYASFDPSPTKNPWNPHRTPGGSSSGSAAAVAAGMCLGAIGSQTGGSITRPASYCGVAGCKPSYGRVSLHGIFPLAPSMDHPGPIARSVRDLALLLDAIAGPDPRDPICSERPYEPVTPLLDAKLLSPPRLGWPRGLFEDRADGVVLQVFTKALDALTDAGAQIMEPKLPRSFDEVLPRHRTVMACEAAAWHELRFKDLPHDYLPEITKLLTEGINTSATEYVRCRQHQAQLKTEMLDCFREVDVLVMPATTSPAPDRTTTGDPAFNSPWSYTGFPVVSIPAGLSADGLPIAIQLVGRPFDELSLFQVARWCEGIVRQVS